MDKSDLTPMRAVAGLAVAIAISSLSLGAQPPSPAVRPAPSEAALVA